MTNQEILTKAVEKAIAGGWKPMTIEKTPEPLKTATDVMEYWDLDWNESPNYTWHIIFNHDFAQGLWPEPGGRIGTAIWKMKLQQMVIADDLIKYLGENL